MIDLYGLKDKGRGQDFPLLTWVWRKRSKGSMVYGRPGGFSGDICEALGMIVPNYLSQC